MCRIRHGMGLVRSSYSIAPIAAGPPSAAAGDDDDPSEEAEPPPPPPARRLHTRINVPWTLHVAHTLASAAMAMEEMGCAWALGIEHARPMLALLA